MFLHRFKATNFRCLEAIEAEFDPGYNLIVGPNAAGKTSILEAIGYLGRGKSFRGAETRGLIRHGSSEFVLTGTVVGADRNHHLGVRNGAGGLESKIDGSGDGGTAALARALPLQVIDPDVHSLVAGGPELRRRFLDWVGFHVERRYLEAWRRYRRGLRQRNAALKERRGHGDLDAWDSEVAESGEALAALQVAVFDAVSPGISEIAGTLLGGSVGLRWRQGWSEGSSLAEVLRDGRERDLQQGATRAGPHRADLVLQFDERMARKLVSRGQQKLLASGIVIGGVAEVQRSADTKLLLLVDDPAAELDDDSLRKLLAATDSLDCQVIAAALTAVDGLFGRQPAVFHVEQGQLTPAT